MELSQLHLKAKTMSSLSNMFRYSAPIDCLIDTQIREYDITKANISILTEKGFLSNEQYQKLLLSNKLDREIYVGKLIGSNPEASKALSDGVLESKSLFFDYNQISDNDVLEIDNDAVYLIGNRPVQIQQVTPYVYFRLSSTYTSFYTVRRIRYYYYANRISQIENLDIKGIGDTAIELHKQYMIDFLKELFYVAQFEGIPQAISLLSGFYQNYCSRSLDIGYYRNLNSQSMFSFVNGFSEYGKFFTNIGNDPRIKKLLDISYNEFVLLEFNKLLSSKYFRNNR